MQTQRLSWFPAARRPWWLLAGFWICVAISIAVVIRRIAVLMAPAKVDNAALAATNATFSSHAALTLAHIVPAAVFVLLAVAVLFRETGARWLLRLLFLFGVVTGLTAYAMSAYAIGGRVERSAVLVFDTWFLFSLGRAFAFYLRGEGTKQREWTSRAVAVLLGIATTRPVMGLFFATSARTHLSPQEFFGIAFWIGFSVNALVIELWLHSKRRARLVASEGLREPQGLQERVWR